MSSNQKRISMMLLAATLFVGPAAWAADISLSASSTTPTVGQTFTVTVNLAGAAPFANWAEFLQFDNTKLQLTAQATGTFSTFIQDSRSLTDINTSGQVRAGGFGQSNNAGGSGSLGVFTFKTLVAGSTSITTAVQSGASPFGDVLTPATGSNVLPTIPGPLSITVGSGVSAPVVSSASTATGTVGTSFSYTITASNTPTSFNVTGLPAGLLVNTASGVISGTPTAAGTSSVTISATNAVGTGTKSLSLTFNAAAAPAISLSASSTTPTVGQTFTVTVNLAGAAPFANWAEFLQFDNTRLQLTAQATGTFNTFIQDSRLLADINTSGQVRAGGFGQSNNTGGIGSLGVFTFKALAAGSTSVSTAGQSGANPFGDVLTPATGSDVLPTVPGPLSITIGSSVSAPVISSAGTANGIVGNSFSYTIAASNTPTSFNATGLPTGLSVNTSTGVISGTPTTAGTSSVTLSATNAGGTGTRTLSLTINAAASPTISLSANSTTPTVGQTFTVTVNLTGAAPFANWAEFLQFDNTKLQLTAQATGSFTTFIPDSRLLADINTSGQMRAGGFGQSNNAGGSGSLGVFTFKALAAGSTSITTAGQSGGNPFGDLLTPATGSDVLPTIAGPLSITVGAPANFTLTVKTAGSGSGTVSLNPPGTSFAAGTVVTLTAAPGAGSAFAGWSGGAAGITNPITVTMTANTTVTATFNTTNQPPTISSSPTATPNPAVVGQAVAFSAAATDPNSDVLTYAWTFGDGSTGTGNAPSHVFTSAGTYSVQLAVSDAGGLNVTASVSVLVQSNNDGTGGNGGTGGSGGTGDGGNGGGAGGSPKTNPLTVSKLAGNSHFKTNGHDSALISGVLPGLSNPFNPVGQSLTLNIGGATVVYTLDGKGKGKSGQGSFAFKLKRAKGSKGKSATFVGGNVPFTAKIQKGTWATAWGLDLAANAANQPITMVITVNLNGVLYSTQVALSYTGKASVGGKFKK